VTEAPKIPVVLLTGHLGSGKTTLLNAYLGATDAARTAVIINEFGAVGLDHQLVRQTTETIVLLENGCICCAVRDDLVGTLKDLLAEVRAGRLPRFARVVIETTGLADPVPVVHSMMNDLEVVLNYELTGVITLVDAVHGRATLARFPEARKQVALADTLVLTKTDLAARDEAARLGSLLALTNPVARVVAGAGAGLRALFETRLFDPRERSAMEHWLERSRAAGGAAAAHMAGVQSYCIRREAPLDWQAVAHWIDALVTRHGPQLLRVKGLLSIRDEPLPQALHGIQHLFHPPEPLPAWPDEDRATRVVFIVADLPQAEVEAALDAAEAATRVAAPGA
jgi:G3E family GTPase